MFENTDNRSFFAAQPAQDLTVARTFMSQVFTWMFAALLVTAATAYWFASSAALMGNLVNAETGGLSGLGWIVTLSPIGFVLLMSLGFQRLSAPVMTLLFITFAVLMGMSLSFILAHYTGASVFKTFAIAAGMFGVMAVTGYTTKTDLTKFGSIMTMGLIGLIIASLVNMIWYNGMMDLIISVLGVLIFTGLTAYDVQRLKKIGAGAGEYSQENVKKLSILGAMTLYLDFINLFLFLLRFLGDRK